MRDMTYETGETWDDMRDMTWDARMWHKRQHDMRDMAWLERHGMMGETWHERHGMTDMV